jgi:hypothetical protein
MQCVCVYAHLCCARRPFCEWMLNISWLLYVCVNYVAHNEINKLVITKTGPKPETYNFLMRKVYFRKYLIAHINPVSFVKAQRTNAKANKHKNIKELQRDKLLAICGFDRLISM